MRVTIEEAGKRPFKDIIDEVRTTQEPIVVTDSEGDLVKVVPVPKPVRHFKGRPVYKLGDVQNLDFPYWNESTEK